jgi:hypothetical protein
LQHVHPQLRERLAPIETVALLPPDVRVYRRGLTRSEVSDEWSQTARTSVADAVTAGFGADGRLVLKQVDPTQAQEEFEQARHLFASTVERGAGRPQDDPFQCVPGPLPTLHTVVEADAWLLVYALDHVKTVGRHVGEAAAGVGAFAAGAGMMLGGLATLSAPLGYSGAAIAGGTVYGAQVYEAYAALKPGENVFAMCLLDAKTGETLWFDQRRFRRQYNLRDRGSVEALVNELYERFRKRTLP